MSQTKDMDSKVQLGGKNILRVPIAKLKREEMSQTKDVDSKVQLRGKKVLRVPIA